VLLDLHLVMAGILLSRPAAADDEVAELLAIDTTQVAGLLDELAQMGMARRHPEQ
jgi:hypothetical protein